MMRELLSFLPSNNLESAPERPTSDPIDRPNDALEQIIPSHANQPYDMKKVIREIADDHHFFETQAHFGKSIVVGFARLGGMPVGIVGNQPSVLAGVLDIDSSTKAARFVRFCDAFNLPLVTLEDVPGFLPGTRQEFGGIIRHGAKLLYAFAEATVPKLTVITRKAYGGAYCVMASKHLRTDLNLAFPNAEIAVMGPEGAVNILYRKELSEAQDPVAERNRLVEAYGQSLCTPFIAAEAGYIDEVIHPRDTRKRLAQSLQMLIRKRESMPAKKHGNIPL
jgi:propionyl-CoA carboxylase beta chain